MRKMGLRETTYIILFKVTSNAQLGGDVQHEAQM